MPLALAPPPARGRARRDAGRVALRRAKRHAGALPWRLRANRRLPVMTRSSMPTLPADRLITIGASLLRAAGASADEAQAVAVGCVNANLAGHDSHGIIAIPTYIDRIKVNHIVPGAKWTIVQESPATTVIDGHWGFGFYVNARAMELTIE